MLKNIADEIVHNKLALDTVDAEFWAHAGAVIPDFGETVSSFEMRCLEAILATSRRRLALRAQCFGPVVERLLEQVTSEEPEEALSKLVRVQRALTELERGCDSIVQCLGETLGSDDEMLSLLLTAKKTLPEGALPHHNNHVAVESLLENHHYGFKDVSDQLFLNIKAIEATRRAVQISLESKRTRLLTLQVHVSIAAVALASISTIGSIFGMNLASGLEEAPGMFQLATSISVLLAVVVYGTYLSFLRYRERALRQRLARMTRMRAIANQMPDLTDVILSYMEEQATDHLTLEQFRQLVKSDEISHFVPAAEVEALFMILDSDSNGILQGRDVADF